VSVRWRPLLTHSRKRFWKFCTTRCSMVGEIAATSSLMFCFKSTAVLGFFSYSLLLRYPQRKKYRDYGHSFRWILKCRRNINWVTTTESLFLKIVSTAKTRCSTDQRSMATEMLWVLLERRSRINSTRQRFHSQLCYQIVRYFCRTLYLWILSTEQAFMCLLAPRILKCRFFSFVCCKSCALLSYTLFDYGSGVKGPALKIV